MTSKKGFACAVILLFLLVFPLTLLARDIAPIVSTDWLEKNLTNAKLRVIDIRKVEEFKEGHVPGAVNAFFGSWVTKQGPLQNQLPAEDDLTDLLNSLGISKDSLVVVVGKADNPGELTNITRVAWTLAYAGVTNFAVLDGGYNKWVADKKKVSQEVSKPGQGNYAPVWNRNIVASKNYVQEKMKNVTLVDVRLPEFFFGVSKLDFVPKAGHIPGAVNLPSAWVFTKEGTFKPRDDLEAMAKGVIGTNKSAEIIAYCDTGKFCTAWWFLLKELLGYSNVKIYDGSMEEWARDNNAPMVKYTWK